MRTPLRPLLDPVEGALHRGIAFAAAPRFP
jgi:hypothetical protein